MQERSPLQEETDYKPNDDILDDANYYIDTGKGGVDNLIDEEMSEPELMFLVKEDSEATALLKKCSKWANEGNWTTMKNYLESIVDNLSLSQTEGIPNEKSFVKCFYKGVCNFRTKEYQESLSNFIDAQKIHQHYQINYNIALCYIKLNNLENAVFYLEAVTKKNRNFFFAYYNLIKIYLKKNNINDAFLIYRDFSEIIKKEKDKEKLSEQTGITPDNRLSVTSFNTLKLFYKIGAECLFAKQLYQECVYTILDALKFNPEDAELWFLYAKVFVMKKSFEYAIPLLKKSLDIQPDYPEAKKLLDFLEHNME